MLGTASKTIILHTGQFIRSPTSYKMAKTLMCLSFTLLIVLLCTRQSVTSPLKTSSENPALDRVLESLGNDARKHMPALDKFEAITAMMSGRHAEAVKDSVEELCCYPNQYESRSITVSSDTYSSKVTAGAIFADAINGKRLEITISQETWAILYVKKDDVVFMFAYRSVDQTCYGNVALPGFDKVMDPCYVLPDANYVGGITVGGGNQSIPVQVWEAMDEVERKYTLMLTPEVCAPVFQPIDRRFGLLGSYSFEQTYNFKASISDQTVFSVPSYCPNITSATPMAQWQEQLKRFTELHML